MQKLIWVLCSVLLVACQALQGENIPATLQTELTAYATQSSAIRAAAQQDLTQAAATIQVAETQAAVFMNFNSMLLATAQAGVPPTPHRMIADDGMVTLDANMLGGAMNVLLVAISADIDFDTRCPKSVASAFNIERIESLYLIVQVINVSAGTRFEAVWEANGQEVFRSAWAAANATDVMCIALELAKTDVEFITGEWAASLVVNEQTHSRVLFTMASIMQ